MKKYLYILTILSAFILLSCGEDRSYEYENLTQHNIWMFDIMSDKYLFSENFSEQTWKDYFASPDKYFKKLTDKASSDKSSYIIVDSIANDPHKRGHFLHNVSYGFDYVLMKDPTNSTTKQYVRVVTVYPDSPAERAKLKRDDYIETYSGIKITAANQDKLEKGTQITLQVRNLVANRELSVFEWDSLRTVILPAAEKVEDKAFMTKNYFEIDGNRIGYLMCNQLIESSDGPGISRAAVDNVQVLDEIIAGFRQKDINHLVLDLRLCNFGTLEMSRRLASYIIPPNSLDKIYAKTFYNVRNQAKNDSITFDTSLRGKTLDLDYVYVITSGYTKGAAEWLINGLIHALGAENVVTIGAKTAGDNLLTQHAGDYNDMIHLYPAVAYVSDASGDYESYSKGITPTISDDEFNYTPLYEYGHRHEALLSKAIEHILENSE